MVIDLDTDWLEIYYDGELLDYMEWTAGWDGDMLGALNIGAVDLFANGATPIYYDDMSLRPFGAEEAGPAYSLYHHGSTHYAKNAKLG